MCMHTLFTNVVCELVKINDQGIQNILYENLNTRKLFFEVYTLMCFFFVLKRLAKIAYCFRNMSCIPVYLYSIRIGILVIGGLPFRLCYVIVLYLKKTMCTL